jgi:hypothetical protein
MSEYRPFWSQAGDDAPEWGYATAEEARRDAEKQLDADQTAAASDGEWPPGVDGTCWGVVLGRVVEHPDPHTCDECDGVGRHEDDCLEAGDDLDAVDYRLEPVPGAIEAVLGLASVEQLRTELARRDGAWVPSDPYLRWTGAKPALTEAGRAAGLARCLAGCSRAGLSGDGADHCAKRH